VAALRDEHDAAAETTVAVAPAPRLSSITLSVTRVSSLALIHRHVPVSSMRSDCLRSTSLIRKHGFRLHVIKSNRQLCDSVQLNSLPLDLTLPIAQRIIYNRTKTKFLQSFLKLPLDVDEERRANCANF